MINLLPPEVKKQIKYSKFNSLLKRYAILFIVIGTVLSGILISGTAVNQYFTKDVEARLAEQEKQIAKFSETEQKARDIDSQIKKVSSVLNKTTRYSEVVEDIAKALPKDSRIAGLNLTGDIKQPLTITVVAETEASALAVEPSLEKLDRFSFVDIQAFRELNSSFEVDLVISFAGATEATR